MQFGGRVLNYVIKWPRIKTADSPFKSYTFDWIVCMRRHVETTATTRNIGPTGPPTYRAGSQQQQQQLSYNNRSSSSMNNYSIAILFVALATSGAALAQSPRSATDLAFDMYHSCLKDFSTACVTPKAMHWFDAALTHDEIPITEKLSIVRTGGAPSPAQPRSANPQEQLFDSIDHFLATHALRVQAPEFFKSPEARSYVPDFLLNNALTRGAVVPLAERSEGRGFVRKVMLPFLLGLKLKTTVLVPLALALIALKTWKAMTLGLLSLVLSGALVIFKIAKPKIVNYEVVHYPPHHVDHLEHLPPHLEHIVPHHLEHVVPHHLEHFTPNHIEHVVPHHLEHHVDHHLDLPHHIEHVEHLEHSSPEWDPHAWSRSSQEPQDAQEIAYNGQQMR